MTRQPIHDYCYLSSGFKHQERFDLILMPSQPGRLSPRLAMRRRQGPDRCQRIQTFDGRYLVVIFEMKGKGVARVITGWDMSDSEKRYYSKSKKG